MSKRQWMLLGGLPIVLFLGGAQGSLWHMLLPMHWAFLVSFIVGLCGGLSYGIYATTTWFD